MDPNGTSAFGYRAGHDARGDRIICLGYRAGPNSDDGDQSDRLYIDVEQNTDALIYGEFDTDFVRINGTFEVTAGLTNPSSRNLKSNFSRVDPQEILHKVAALDISEWQYKKRPSERHIGPAAEEFYAAFNYGVDDKHISTIDADGVALAAIKALYLEKVKQQRTIEKQQSAIQHLRRELEELKALVSLIK